MKSKPLVMAFRPWLEHQLARVSGKSGIAEELRYGLNHWEGLVRFLDDGRIELDTNIVERGIRPTVLNRKDALFACYAGWTAPDGNPLCQAAGAENPARRPSVMRRSESA